MHQNKMSVDKNIKITPKPRFLDVLVQRSVVNRLSQLKHEHLQFDDGGQITHFGEPREKSELCATVTIHDQRFYTELAFGGTIGAGEAYMLGYWSTDNLTALMRIFLRNREILNEMEGGLALFTRPIQKFLHRLSRNTHKGSKRNIRAHYDLGNDFFKLFLDPSMMYSSAIFDRSEQTLQEAQMSRLDRICKLLDLKPSDHLLEIGSGWGSMAIYAAKEYGCRVTTTTISQQQYEWAKERIHAENLTDRVNLLQKDYRELEGKFDKLVSIEMIEAVGHNYYEAFFAKCSSLLKENGLMLLQAITIADQQYESARRSVDFIQRYIFPGSCIPSITRMMNSITQATNMRLIKLDDIGLHYAKTLRLWRHALMTHVPEVRALGYPESFIRMWLFYFSYCEGGFIERAISDVHMLLAKPKAEQSVMLI
jgi:cyclopropane-fatty-acyl-phospholipid synthase